MRWCCITTLKPIWSLFTLILGLHDPRLDFSASTIQTLHHVARSLHQHIMAILAPANLSFLLSSHFVHHSRHWLNSVRKLSCDPSVKVPLLLCAIVQTANNHLMQALHLHTHVFTYASRSLCSPYVFGDCQNKKTRFTMLDPSSVGNNTDNRNTRHWRAVQADEWLFEKKKPIYYTKPIVLQRWPSLSEIYLYAPSSISFPLTFSSFSPL